jgi:hypothetical protein
MPKGNEAAKHVRVSPTSRDIGHERSADSVANDIGTSRRDESAHADHLAFAFIRHLRDHARLSNVLTHVSRGNWTNLEAALRPIFDLTAQSRNISPLSRNLIELICADRGVAGQIMKPYFRRFLASELGPELTRLVMAHVTTLFLEDEMQDPFGTRVGHEQKVAIVQIPSTMAAQEVFQDIIDRWHDQIRIAGMIEERGGTEGRTCRAGQLRSISNGAVFPMFEESYKGGAACDIEEAGVASASSMVCRDIAAGCDLVILSKFGKLESAGQGLRTAFAASVEAGMPLLTYAPHMFSQSWTSFIDSRAIVFPVDASAIDDWLRSLLSIRRSMASP